MTRVVYFTGGTLGAGHQVRAVAIARALARSGWAGELRAVIPRQPVPALAPALAPLDPVVTPIDAAEVLDPAAASGSALAATLRELDPELLIADLFWAPLLYIAPELVGCTKWLLVRRCPDHWLTGRDECIFDRSQWDRVVAIEPIEDDAVSHRIDPIVVCNRDEVRSRTELCDRFEVDPARRVLAISHAGLAGEIDKLRGPDDADAAILRFDLHQPDAVFPIAPWIAGADKIYCSAGYNSYWESRWLGFASRCSLSLFRRKIDNPLWRVKMCADYSMRENGADTLATWIAAG